MDPMALLVLLALTLVLFYACAINTGAPAAALDPHATDHGLGHGDEHPQGDPGEVAHPREH